MPPVPRALDDESGELIDGLRRREKDLVDFQLPRLRDCTGPLSTQQQYAAEFREDLDVFTKQIEALELHADDTLKKADRVAVKEIADAFRESSQLIRKDMRTALLQSKKAIDARSRSNREELFKGAAPDSRNVEDKATDDALMKASNDVTEALRRTLGLMHGELERSVLSHQMLEQSTATLRATSTQHDLLSRATRASRQLIHALEQSDWLDRLLVLGALAFFVLVVLFIAKQRIFDRGLRIAFWWTRFLPLPGPAMRGGPAGKAKDVLADVLVEEGRRAVTRPSSLREALEQTASRLVSETLSSAASPSMAESASTQLDTSMTSILDSIASASSDSLPAASSLTEFLSSESTSTLLEHAEL